MTVTVDGIRAKKLDEIKQKKDSGSRTLILSIICFEFIVSVFLYISLAAHIIWPEKSMGAVGVSQMISYEGYLTDSSGNPLGGTGTAYCFRFSIYDNPHLNGGTKLWPAGTPATTMGTVTDGVFNGLIGQADSLTYNFYDSDSVYLNVEVNTTPSTCAGSWESLGPRQQIAASGYAIASESVYGDIFRTDITNSRAQVGTGAGAASPKYLGLDVKNTADYVGESCTTSGTVWYNSAVSKALVCEGSVIRALSNATSTIASITVNGVAGASSGTVVFSNSNGVTFGINGQTITASVAGGGGAAQTYSVTNFANIRGVISSGSLGQNSLYILPQTLTANVSGSLIRMPIMVTNSSSGFAAHTRGYTANFGIYSRHATNSTVLTSFYSTSYTASFSASSNASWHIAIITGMGNTTSYNTLTASSAGLNLSASVHGPRHIIFPLQSTFSTGEYWFAFRNSSSSAGAAGNLFNLSHLIATHQTQNRLGQSTNASNTGAIFQDQGLGTYSATTAAFPGGISMTQINPLNTSPVFYYMNGSV